MTICSFTSWYAGGTQVRTRAVDLNSGGRAEWNEQLVLDLAAPSGELAQALAASMGSLECSQLGNSPRWSATLHAL